MKSAVSRANEIGPSGRLATQTQLPRMHLCGQASLYLNAPLVCRTARACKMWSPLWSNRPTYIEETRTDQRCIQHLHAEVAIVDD